VPPSRRRSSPGLLHPHAGEVPGERQCHALAALDQPAPEPDAGAAGGGEVEHCGRRVAAQLGESVAATEQVEPHPVVGAAGGIDGHDVERRRAAVADDLLERQRQLGARLHRQHRVQPHPCP
jgi:hypothetical protein